MDSFIVRRAGDARFQNERRVGPVGSSNGEWYLAQKRATRSSHHTFSAGYDENHKMTPHKDDKSSSDSGRKKKKKKKDTDEKHYEFSKSGEPFSKSEKMKLENRTSSDDSDGGPCWSDYERVPGKKAGEKGSCKPKS